MRKKQSGVGESGQGGEKKEKGEREREDFLGVPTVGTLELKFVQATRATRGYQNSNFSLKLQEEGVFSYTGSSLFKSR